MAAIDLTLQLSSSGFLSLAVGWSRKQDFDPSLGQTLLYSWPFAENLSPALVDEAFPYVPVPPDAKNAFVVLLTRSDDVYQRVRALVVNGHRSRRVTVPVSLLSDGVSTSSVLVARAQLNTFAPILSSGISMEIPDVESVGSLMLTLPPTGTRL